MKKNRLTFLETDENLVVTIPPPRFNSPLTIVCIFSDVLFAFPLLLIAYAAYYSNTIYKIFLIPFSIPWIGGAIAFNIILATCFFDKTLIKANSEQINIFRTFKMSGKNIHSFPISEIVNIKIIEEEPQKSKDSLLYIDVILVLDKKNSEFKFTFFVFDKEEIILLASKIESYTGQNPLLLI